MNTFTTIARGVDLFAMSVVLGATAWFFFIQSPMLFKSMSRERFLPLQMRLTVLFFNAMTILLGVMLAGAAVQPGSVLGWPTITAAVAFVAVGINKLIIVPMALRAGGRSMGKREGQGETGTAVDFANGGAGQSTKALHRAVVAMVVVMVAGLVAHGIVLTSLSPGS